MGAARFALRSANFIGNQSLSSAVRGARRSRLRRLCASLALVALAWGGLNLARAQVTPISTWTQQSPATSPPARDSASMAYDAATGQVVLFGGEASSALLNDTWTWNGTIWTQQSPANSPAAREEASMAYDAATGQVVLFGGLDPSSVNGLNDTWTWDGTNWTQQNPATSPPGRFVASMAYDAASGQVVLFGGTSSDTSSNFLNDTWTWDGMNWTQQSPATSPSERILASIAYDAVSGEVVLFGGQAFSGALLGDTWTWNGTNWTQQSPANSPSAGEGASMAYDAASSQVVLFGGPTGGPDETWTWDGVNWTQQSPATSPPARDSASMAYDAASSRVLLFGGATFNPDNPSLLNDTWTLNLNATNLGRANVCLGGATTPSPCSQSTTLSFDVAANTTIGSINILTQGAANLDFKATSPDTSTTLCTAQTYTTETVCTVDVTFAPRFPGQRLGGVVLEDGSGNVLSNTYVFGTGVGPQVTFANTTSGSYLPSTQSALGSGFNEPLGVAVDASGNVYVADTFNNAVKEIVAVNGGIPASPTINTLGSGFAEPSDVAVDGSGNIYVADLGHSKVKEIVAVNGSIPASPTIKTLGSGFSQPIGVAVDGSGNVFVANTGKSSVNEIVAVNGSIPASPTINTLGSGFSQPFGVAVDAAGDVFVADQGSTSVKEIVAVNGTIPASPTINTLGSGFNGTFAVAVDAAGNVFVADFGNNAVKEIVAVNGSIPASPTINTLGSGFEDPRAMAVDGSGNVFVADSQALQELDFSAPPNLSFAATDFGSESSDSPQTVTVSNDGNAALSFPVPAMGNNPSIPSSFTLDSSVTCPQVSSSSNSAGMLNAGSSCTLPFDFIPAAIGGINGSAVLTDNNLNAGAPNYAMQTIMVSGTGLQIPQTITFTSPGTGNQVFRGTVMVSATGGGSGNPVTFTSQTTSVCANPNSQGLSMLISPGVCTFAANQAGNTDYSAAPQATQSFTVTQATQTITFSNPGSQIQGGTVMASATGGGSGNPVEISSLTTSVCTVPSGTAPSPATVSLIAPGTCELAANQAGNTDYSAAPQVTQSFSVTPVFVLTVTPSTTTASRPGNEPVVLKLMPVNGFKGPVTLNCILPAGVASGTKCPGLPDTVALNGTSTVSYSTGVLFPNTTRAGTYVVRFTAVDGKFNDSTTATFIIK